MTYSHDALIFGLLECLAKLPHGDHRSATWLAGSLQTTPYRINQLINANSELFSLIRAKRCVSVGPSRKPVWFRRISNKKEWPVETLREEQARLPSPKTALASRAKTHSTAAAIQQDTNLLRINLNGSVAGRQTLGQIENRIADLIAGQVEESAVRSLELIDLKLKLDSANARNAQLADAFTALARRQVTMARTRNVVSLADAAD